MFTHWPEFISSCRSRLSAIARSCFLSRERWSRKHARLVRLIRGIQGERDQARLEADQWKSAYQQVVEQLKAQERERAQPRPIELPVGEPPPGHQYGANLIALSVNLARQIGLRPTTRALTLIFRWLRVDQSVPTYQSIREWMRRIGLARQQRGKKRDGGVWLVDHTNQIGRDRVLTILRPRERFQSKGMAPLRLRDMEVLAVIPGKQWRREEVGDVYRATAELRGTPRAVVSDGAVELREPVKMLGTPQDKPLHLRDTKHFLANQLERFLTKDVAYQEFVKKISGIRSALQQTELAHFIPPPMKVKARFMNLAPTLRWVHAVLWHLAHPESRGRREISVERMQDKFGWLRSFEPAISSWTACHEMIGFILDWVRHRGIYRGAARDLGRHLKRRALDEPGKRLARKTIAFLRSQETRLAPHEHLPLSTEVLESAFSRYKQLIRQHVKWGLSGILIALPTLLAPVTATEVANSLAQVSVADVRSWTKNNLEQTYASQRNNMYKDARTSSSRSKSRATRIPHLA